MGDQYLANWPEVRATSAHSPRPQSSNMRGIQATTQEYYISIPEQAVRNTGIPVALILQASEDHRRETGNKFEKAVDLYKTIRRWQATHLVTCSNKEMILKTFGAHQPSRQSLSLG